MKKIIISIGICCLAIFSYGQDLISNAEKGNFPRHLHEPNTLAQAIEEATEQSAVFTAFDPFEWSAQRSTAVDQAVGKSVMLKLKPETLRTFWRKPATLLTVEVPVTNDRSVELQLKYKNILAESFRMTDEKGGILETPHFLAYQGIVKDQNNSLVSMVIFEDHIRILIADQDGNYVLGPLRNTSNDYIFYHDKQLKEHPTFDCDADNHIHPEAEAAAPLRNSFQDAGDCVELFMECDFAMYQTFESNSGQVAAYVFGLINEVATLYANESINIELSQILIWTSMDPYATASNTSDALQLFGEFRQNNYNGRLAHLLSSRALGGGIAWVDVLCSEYFTFMDDVDDDGMDELRHAGPYGVSAIDPTFNMVPTYSWSVMVVTHELGHNFGSSHTHACVWNGDNTQIDDCGNIGGSGDGVFDDDDDGEEDDGCYNPLAADPMPIIPAGGGTIMSYCHLNAVGISLGLGFGPQPGDLIRAEVAGAGCLNENCSCDIFDNRLVNGNPISSGVYIASQTITSTGDVDAVGEDFVQFLAGDQINLEPGFEAEPHFYAGIQSDLCDDGGAGGSFTSDLPEAITQEQRPNANLLEVFPNPVMNELQIRLDLQMETVASLRVINQYGQELLQIIDQDQLRAQVYQLSLNVSDWPAGLYHLHLQTESGNHLQSFVVGQ